MFGAQIFAFRGGAIPQRSGKHLHQPPIPPLTLPLEVFERHVGAACGDNGTERIVGPRLSRKEIGTDIRIGVAITVSIAFHAGISIQIHCLERTVRTPGIKGATDRPGSPD